MKITYKTFCPTLKRTFVDTRTFRTMEDFRLFAYALFSGNWEIISVD